MGHDLMKLTWKDAVEVFKKAPLALVPVGSVEQHGPHMPLGTDTLLAEELARRAAERMEEAVLVPAIPVGYAEYHTDFPGTLSVSPATLAAYIGEICDQLVRHGITHIVFVDGHGGNLSTLELVGRSLRARGVAAATVLWWDVAGAYNPDWGLRGHGDVVEASMVMGIDAGLVRLERARIPQNKSLTEKLPILDGTNCRFGKGVVKIHLHTCDVSDTGDMMEFGHSTGVDYTTSPAQATAGEGEKILDLVAGYIADFGREFLRVKLSPLKS